ncbi:MAG: hypothetical protein LUD24_02240 [Phascolarctobacterium sp.]|nr:hypothetical protein [Phascolarctobacterium sp.]
MILFLIKLILGLIILGVLVVAVYIARQGDAKIELKTAERTKAEKNTEKEDRIDFSLDIPYVNSGTQEGTILDAYLRIYLPEEQYDGVLLRGKVNLKDALRGDDYFEAVLVPAGTGKTMVLRFEAYARNGGNIEEALSAMPDVDVALFADCRGRGELYTVKETFTLSATEMLDLVKGEERGIRGK